MTQMQGEEGIANKLALKEGNSSLLLTPPTLAQSSLIMSGFLAVSLALRYVFLVTASWLLSPDEYGLLGVSLAILAIGGLATGAFPWAVTKFTSEGKGRLAFRTAFLGNLSLGIVLAILLYVGYAVGLLGLKAQDRSLLFLIIILGLVSAIGGVYEGALKGLFRFWAVGFIRVLDQLITLGGVLFIALGWGAAGALLGFLIAGIAVTLLGWYYTRDQSFLGSGRWIDREVLRFTWPMLVAGVSGYLILNLDILGVKAWGGENASAIAGYYQSALVLARVPLVVILSSVMEAYFPFIARLSPEKKRVETYMNRMVKYAFIFCLPLVLALAILPKELLGIMFPQDYQVSASALSILAGASFFMVFVFLLARTLQATVGPAVPAGVLAGAAFLQIGLLYGLVPRYGLMGAATATSGASFTGLVGLTWIYSRHYKLRLPKLPLISLALASASYILLLRVLPTSHVPLLLAGLALSGVFFILTLILLRAIDQEDVELILSGVLGKESRVKAQALRLVKTLNRA